MTYDKFINLLNQNDEELKPNATTDGSKIFYTFEVPGIKKKNLKIKLMGETLVITGEREDKKVGFSEKIGIVEKIKAVLLNGILSIEITSLQSKEIEIPIEDGVEE